jgi:hypothetical protein
VLPGDYPLALAGVLAVVWLGVLAVVWLGVLALGSWAAVRHRR